MYGGIAFTGPLGYFSDILATGLATTFGITNSENEFWQYGASIGAIYMKGNEQNNELMHENFNIIEYMLFLPITLNGGISIKTVFYTTIQPFAGAGMSIDAMKTGKEVIFLEGEPFREANTMKWYINPVLTAGLRLPIALGGFFISPFAQAYAYTGSTIDGREYGFLLLLGAQIYW